MPVVRPSPGAEAEMTKQATPRAFGDEKPCGCESELHGHGYPCGGTARVGERRVWGVGEVCELCFEATEPEYRLHDLAAPGVRRRRR